MRSPNFWQDVYQLPNIDRTVKILFLGRLSPDKNWEFNCKCLTQLQQHDLPPYTIIIAGTGELEDELRQTLAGLPVVMLGEVTRDRILPLLANVDLHVTSSLKETFGRTVRESLSVGTPVLAPDCPWTRNLITPDVDGILYRAQDGADFIGKLTDLLRKADLRATLRANVLSNLSRSKTPDPASEWLKYLQSFSVKTKA